MKFATISAIALDLGTTTIKAGLLLQNGVLDGVVVRAAPCMTVEDGRYESDALAYAEIAEAVLTECMAQTNEHPPLGLCSQRSSFLIWEREGGIPVTPLISWQDGRGAKSCEELRDKESVIRKHAGLPLTPYYMAPKLRILLRENPLWRERLKSGEWLLGTLDSFLIWRWTEHYLTDASMAARTLLMDIHDRQWSHRLCKIFDVPLEVLPQIRPSTGWELPLKNGLTLQASIGDQSAALVATIDKSDALVNLGTGGFVICHVPIGSSLPVGYLQTLVCQKSAGQVYFACEGTLNSIASALAPYRVDACHIEDLARDDIFCIAEPSGLGAPYLRYDIGLSFSASIEQLPPQRVAVLLLEGIIFRVARILEDMHHAYGIECVYLSGGLSGLSCLQQGIALCVPFAATYFLPQHDSSLSGAAQLAAGVTHVSGSSRVEISRHAPGLPEKYARWKIWLDELLSDE